MQEVEKIVNQVLEVLDKFDNALDIALWVYMTIFLRSVKKSVCSPTVETKAESDVQKQVNARKAEKLEIMKKGIDLYYSGKKVEEMTAQEQELFQKTSEFLNGGKA